MDPAFIKIEDNPSIKDNNFVIISYNSISISFVS